MGLMYPVPYGAIESPGTGKSRPAVTTLAGMVRLPTDPLFYSTLVLENIVVGSRYWVARATDLTQVIASGVAATTTLELANLPAYANPMLIEIRVRLNTPGGSRYLPFTTYANLVKGSVTAYISQIQDAIAS